MGRNWEILKNFKTFYSLIKVLNKFGFKNPLTDMYLTFSIYEAKVDFFESIYRWLLEKTHNLVLSTLKRSTFFKKGFYKAAHFSIAYFKKCFFTFGKNITLQQSKTICKTTHFTGKNFFQHFFFWSVLFF